MACVTATYLVETEEPKLALRAITRGQSIGNPSILTKYETEAFVKKWSARGKISHESHEGTHVVTIQWPEHNFGNEGVNYLLSVVMGGQCDIDLIQGCRLMELDLASCERHYSLPRYGVTGIRRLMGITNSRALVGGIIKPKIGLTPAQLAEIVHQMADGGVDFIKEDEILADQYWCPMRKRLPLVTKALTGYQTLYAPCITGDSKQILQRARLAHTMGAGAIHLNIWCGLGAYVGVRKAVKLPLFFQKSGDKIWTTGPFSIDYSVICQLVHLIGCDFAHVGMYGGYLAEEVGVLERRIKKLQTTIPSFSCGMTPDLAEQIIQRFGTDLMVTSGGWIHGQPEGITAACQQMRRSVERASAARLQGRLDSGRFRAEPAAHEAV